MELDQRSFLLAPKDCVTSELAKLLLLNGVLGRRISTPEVRPLSVIDVDWSRLGENSNTWVLVENQTSPLDVLQRGTNFLSAAKKTEDKSDEIRVLYVSNTSFNTYLFLEAMKELKAPTLITLPEVFGPDENLYPNPGLVARMIDLIVRAKQSGEPPKLPGNYNDQHEFIYSKDVAMYLLQIIAAENLPHINLGQGRVTTNEDIAAKVSDHIGYEGAVIWDGKNNNQRVIYDSRATIEKHGFDVMTTPLGPALKETIDNYFLNNRKRRN